MPENWRGPNFKNGEITVVRVKTIWIWRLFEVAESKKISPVESKIHAPAYGKFREFCVSNVLKGWQPLRWHSVRCIIFSFHLPCPFLQLPAKLLAKSCPRQYSIPITSLWPIMFTADSGQSTWSWPCTKLLSLKCYFLKKRKFYNDIFSCIMPTYKWYK